MHCCDSRHRVMTGNRQLGGRSASVLFLVGLSALLTSCGGQEPASDALYRSVDDLYALAARQSEGFEVIAEIDHSRLAAAEGEVMPPARVIIFSDSELNTALLAQAPLAGLDLPFRVLAYAEEDTARFTHTTADFLLRRHGLEYGPELERYDELLRDTLSALPDDARVSLDSSSVSPGDGIVSLDSNHDFDRTIERLKAVILEESDTVWFGEIDYAQEAKAHGAELPRLTLLLWGAPAPGAKAMREYPRMGLDAFCQKTLVAQRADGSVQVTFNDMPAIAEMHYGDSALPHHVIARRMRSTLEGATEGAR